MQRKRRLSPLSLYILLAWFTWSWKWCFLKMYVCVCVFLKTVPAFVKTIFIELVKLNKPLQIYLLINLELPGRECLINCSHLNGIFQAPSGKKHSKVTLIYKEMRARKTCLSSLFRIQCVFGSPLHSPVRLSLLVMFLGLPGLWGWDGEACARFGGDTGPRELQWGILSGGWAGRLSDGYLGPPGRAWGGGGGARVEAQFGNAVAVAVALGLPVQVPPGRCPPAPAPWTSSSSSSLTTSSRTWWCRPTCTPRSSRSGSGATGPGWTWRCRRWRRSWATSSPPAPPTASRSSASGAAASTATAASRWSWARPASRRSSSTSTSWPSAPARLHTASTRSSPSWTPCRVASILPSGLPKPRWGCGPQAGPPGVAAGREAEVSVASSIPPVPRDHFRGIPAWPQPIPSPSD